MDCQVVHFVPLCFDRNAIFFLFQMSIKRFFSSESSRRASNIEIRNANVAVILAYGAVASGSFGYGLYLNQIKVFEEKLLGVKEMAKKDVMLAEEKLLSAKVMARRRKAIGCRKKTISC